MKFIRVKDHPKILEQLRAQKVPEEQIEKMIMLDPVKNVILRPAQDDKKGWWYRIERWLTRPVSSDARNKLNPDGTKKKIKTMDDERYERRYLRIHVIAKNFLFKPALSILKKVLGPYLIKSLKDIPAEPYNNHHRIFYYCWQEALIDTFIGPDWDKGEIGRRPEAKANGFDNRDDYIRWLQDTRFWSWDNRKKVIDIWMTEIMEDSFDREWMNYFMTRMYWEMNELYKGNVPKPGEYPVFTGTTANNPPYFHRFIGHPVWNKATRMDKMREDNETYHNKMDLLS